MSTERAASTLLWRRERGAGLRLVVFAVVAAVVGCRSEWPVVAPSGGESLLPAAERAILVLVGEVGAVEPVDRHGYAAGVKVLRKVRGDAVVGERVRVAWEELARGRAPRLQRGDVILVAVEPLPSGSLWDQRFPGARGRGDVLVIAARGEAYLRHPGGGDIDLLSAYLSLPAEQRQEAAGVGILTAMVEQAAPGLAASALARIESVAQLASCLDDATVGRLRRVLVDDGRPLTLRGELVRVAAERKLAVLRPALESLAGESGPLRAAALSALAAMDGGLDLQRVEPLLTSESSDLRAVGARYARSPALRQRLAQLVGADPSPEVRAAAAASLMSVAGMEAFGEIVPALADADATVRLAAVEAVSRFGEAAVEPLAKLIESGTVEEATGAILALDQIGQAGKPVLIETASQHPDERIRRLASLALGRMPGHEH